MDILARDRELAVLNEEYEKKGFRMTIVYGRRRVGKTKLLSKFVEDKKSIFYTAVQTGLDDNLESFRDAIFQGLDMETAGVSFKSFDDAFGYISSVGADEPLVLVIDEYPYLAESDSGISSILQRRIDTDYLNTNIHLILCGSQVSFMEEEVLGGKSPLYGRRTSQLYVKPFDYRGSALFVPNYTSLEKAIAYGVTGGIAKYLSLFDPNLDVYENIKKLFFSNSGYLYEEPVNILRQEFRSVQLYSSIITAIANGATQVNQIATKVGISTAGASQALAKLMSVRIVKKESPILNEKNKYTFYSLSDGMFLFWYKFVAGSISMIERGYGDRVFDSRVRGYINEFMGGIFENMCRDFTMELSARGDISVILDDIGWWVGNDKVSREQREIDIVGVSGNTYAVVGECKFRNKPLSGDVVEHCMESSRLLPISNISRYLMFSMSGFEGGIEEKYGSDVSFYTLDDMYASQ